MGRPTREEYKGGKYHVIARGNNKEYELTKNGSRKRKLTEYKLKYAKEAVLEKYTYAEIGQSIKMTDRAVRDMFLRYEDRKRITR